MSNDKIWNDTECQMTQNVKWHKMWNDTEGQMTQNEKFKEMTQMSWKVKCQCQSMTPSRNDRRYTLRSVQSSPGRSFLILMLKYCPMIKQPRYNYWLTIDKIYNNLQKWWVGSLAVQAIEGLSCGCPRHKREWIMQQRIPSTFNLHLFILQKRVLRWSGKNTHLQGQEYPPIIRNIHQLSSVIGIKTW